MCLQRYLSSACPVPLTAIVQGREREGGGGKEGKEGGGGGGRREGKERVGREGDG